MIITTNDFDEIVLNNPFLNDENIGYGIEKLFCKYYINYNPEALKFNGQSNSTCKYIIFENYFSKKKIKVIREDNRIVVKEFSKDNDIETVADEKKLFKIHRKLIDLKKIVNKQIQDYNKSISKITKLKFDIETVEKFADLLNPKLSKIEIESLIEELRNAEENPLNYIGNLSNITNENSAILSQKILFNIIIDELEKINSLIIIDWKSPFEEVYELFESQFTKLKISFEKEISKPKKYETTDFLKTLNELVTKTEYSMIVLGNVSDTYLITFTKKENFNEIKKKAEILKFELNEWN